MAKIRNAKLSRFEQAAPDRFIKIPPRCLWWLIAGFLIDFISLPVIAGFTSAAAITIASGQVKSLLGITVANGESFIFFKKCVVIDD